MPGTKKNYQAQTALDTALRMAAQLPPLARSTSESAKRGVTRTRAWAAPQLERGGQVLQHEVAPRVSSALSTAAHRIDPGQQPKPRQWRKAVAFSLLAAAGVVTALAGYRWRANAAAPAEDTTASEAAPAEDTTPGDATPGDATPGTEDTHESATH